jgi:hypothetical protein
LGRATKISRIEEGYKGKIGIAIRHLGLDDIDYSL